MPEYKYTVISADQLTTPIDHEKPLTVMNQEDFNFGLNTTKDSELLLFLKENTHTVIEFINNGTLTLDQLPSDQHALSLLLDKDFRSLDKNIRDSYLKAHWDSLALFINTTDQASRDYLNTLLDRNQKVEFVTHLNQRIEEFQNTLKDLNATISNLKSITAILFANGGLLLATELMIATLGLSTIATALSIALPPLLLVVIPMLIATVAFIACGGVAAHYLNKNNKEQLALSAKEEQFQYARGQTLFPAVRVDEQNLDAAVATEEDNEFAEELKYPEVSAAYL